MDKLMLLVGVVGIGYTLNRMGADKIQTLIGVSSVVLVAVATNAVVVEHAQNNNEIILQK